MLDTLLRKGNPKGIVILGLSMLLNSCSINSETRPSADRTYAISMENCRSCHNQLYPLVDSRDYTFRKVLDGSLEHWGPYIYEIKNFSDLQRDYKEREGSRNGRFSTKCWNCHDSNNPVDMFDRGIQNQIQESVNIKNLYK